MSPDATIASFDHANLATGSRTREPGEAASSLAAESFDQRLVDAMLGLANLDRALRRLPPVKVLAELHPHLIERFRAAALEAILVQHPEVVLEAINDAGGDLF